MFEQQPLLGGQEAHATYALAYDEAVRALEAQRQRFESVRTRAGVVFSAAAITTSFFGAHALDGPAGTGAAWIALGLHRDLAVHFESGYQHNEEIQVRVTRAFRIACMLLSLEILAWVVALGL